VAAIGVSEAGAGSDVASIATKARKDGDDYLISGSKLWITSGLQADWICLLVNTSDGKPHENKSLVCVPMDLPGIETRKIRKLGMWSSDTAEIFFDDVRVPQRYRIGDEGRGFMYQMIQFQEERMWGAASMLRSMENLLAETREYAGGREAFGQTILEFQTVHYRLAELETEVELLRSLVYRGCDLYVQGENILRYAAMMKLKAGRLVRELTDSCLQFWGGMGYTWESNIARAYRDSRLISIGGGADEVMLSIICKLNGTLPRRKRK
jgi:citronellyl-CoA dehydrogenase